MQVMLSTPICSVATNGGRHSRRMIWPKSAIHPERARARFISTGLVLAIPTCMMSTLNDIIFVAYYNVRTGQHSEDIIYYNKVSFDFWHTPTVCVC